MARRERLLTAVEANPGNVRFAQLQAVLEAYGFEAHATSGSHVVFRHPDLRLHISIAKPSRGSVKVAYVRAAVRLVHELVEQRDA